MTEKVHPWAMEPGILGVLLLPNRVVLHIPKLCFCAYWDMAAGCLERDIHSLPQQEKRLSTAVFLYKERARRKQGPGLSSWEQETDNSLPDAAMSGWIWGTLLGLLHTGMHMAWYADFSSLPTISMCIRPTPNSLSFSKGSPTATAAHYWSHTHCPISLACDPCLRSGSHCR